MYQSCNAAPSQIAGSTAIRIAESVITMGAFSCGAQGTHPFIMMSWTSDVSGMSTLAHELGHSMHSYLAWSHQLLAALGV